MGNLHADRVSPGEPAFKYTEFDYFGPFEVKRTRSIFKKWGCLFSCLTTLAVHIEEVDSLEADTSLLALQRFIVRRGRLRLVRSDNGGNFVGAVGEIKAAISRWNDSNKLNAYLQQSNIQRITNPASVSHMGLCLNSKSEVLEASFMHWIKNSEWLRTFYIYWCVMPKAS